MMLCHNTRFIVERESGGVDVIIVKRRGADVTDGGVGPWRQGADLSPRHTEQKCCGCIIGINTMGYPARQGNYQEG